MFFNTISRQNQSVFISNRRFLSSLLRSSSKLQDYGFKPPPSLPKNPNSTSHTAKPTTKNPKPPYRPPSSLDRTGQKPQRSNLPFDFRYSYTESNSSVRPIGLREPKYSPFGPGRLDRVWTGVSAPAVDPTVKSVEENVGAEDSAAEKARKERERILGEPLSLAERKILVERSQRNKTKRQVNLGRDGLTHNMLNDIHNHWKHAETVRIKCLGVPTVDMKNVCTQLEDKTGGAIINRQGGTIVLYRGRYYNPKKRPVIPLMLWRPHEPVYPRLIKTVIDGLSNSKTSSVELSELDEMNDSYWTDRIIQGSSEEEPSQKSRKRKGEPQSESPRKRGRPRKQSSSLQSSLKLDSNLKQQVNEDMDGEEECSKLEPKVNDDMNGESQLQRPKKRGRPRKQSNSLQSSPKLDSNLKQQVNEAMDGEEDCSPTALILFFNAADSVPSVTDLSQIFSRYGPLKESDIMRKSNHAKVVFSKRSDAEVAFSSAGKFSIFGPALVSYQLKYLSPKPKASLRASRHSKEDETSAERSNLVSPQLGKDDTRQTRDSSEVPGNETSAERNNLVSPQPGNDDAGQTRDGSEVPGDETSAERNSLVSPQPGKDEAGQTRDDSEVPAQVETKNSISLNENIEAIS